MDRAGEDPLPAAMRKWFCLLASIMTTVAALAADALTAEEQRVIAAVEAGVSVFGPELEKIVQIDSVTENLAGVRQLGEHFVREFQALGFDARFEPLPPETGRAGHFIAERRGARGKRLLLIGHLD